MDIHEIENLSFAELKAHKPDLLEALKATPHEELAARYLQARTDAKLRDEKLAEQAKTLAALRQGLEAVKEKEAAGRVLACDLVASLREKSDSFKKCADQTIADLEAQLKHAAKEGEAEQAVHSKCETDLATRCDDLAKLLTLETRRCERLNTQAKSATAAMTTVQVEALSAISVIQKVVTDVLGNDTTDKADRGE